MAREALLREKKFYGVWGFFLAMGLASGCECHGDDKARVSLNKRALTLAKGVEETLTAQLGSVAATDKELLWESDNPAVAIVDSGGKISALNRGSARISATARASGHEDSCLLKVIEPSIHSFSPKEAAHSSVLLIRGEDFSEGRVTLNGVDAEVFYVAPNEIGVRVQKDAHCAGPERKCTGLVELSVGGTTIAASEKFSYMPTAIVSTFAGNTSGTSDGQGTEAQFNEPYDIVVDAAGNLYVADRGNHLIRKISPDGLVSTLAGNGTQGDQDGPAIEAQFHSPAGIAIDTAGNLYVADSGNHLIRKISSDGLVSTLAGSTAGFVDSADNPEGIAQFNRPHGIVADTAGNLYVVDNGNSRIRKISPDGLVSTHSGPSFFDATTETQAQFLSPYGLTLDAAGNLYVTDSGNYHIRKISPDGLASTVAGNGTRGNQDGPAMEAQFYLPHGIAIDAAGNLYVADTYGHRIRRVSPEGVVSTLAGNRSSHQDGPGADALLSYPHGIALHAETGNLYVADVGSYRIRKMVFE